MEIEPAALALQIIPKITSLFSVLGSVMIIVSCLREKKNRDSVQQRIIFVMSIIDVVVSSMWLFLNLFMPPWSNMKWTYGNYTTCKIQGTILQFNIASGCYSTALALCFLLKLVFDWKERHIQKIEKPLHLFPLALGLGTSIVGFVLDLYHPAGIDCWIEQCPENANDFAGSPDCSASVNQFNRSQITTLQFCMFQGFVLLFFFSISSSTIAIYCKVRKTEIRSSQYRYSRDERRELKRTKQVFWQGVLYAGGFLLTWVFVVTVRIWNYLFPNNKGPMFLIVPAGSLIGIQGSLNAITFFRPKYQALRRKNKDVLKIKILCSIILDTCGCCGKYTFSARGGPSTAFSVQGIPFPQGGKTTASSAKGRPSAALSVKNMIIEKEEMLQYDDLNNDRNNKRTRKTDDEVVKEDNDVLYNRKNSSDESSANQLEHSNNNSNAIEKKVDNNNSIKSNHCSTKITTSIINDSMNNNNHQSNENDYSFDNGNEQATTIETSDDNKIMIKKEEDHIIKDDEIIKTKQISNNNSNNHDDNLT